MNVILHQTVTTLALISLSLSPAAFADEVAKPVTEKLVDTLEQLSGGPHKGFRSNHAKGLVVEGHFTPAPTAAEVTKASIFNTSNPVAVRYSHAGGLPTVADNDAGGFPKGMAIRFLLPDQSRADLVLISVNGFPSATPEEFLGLLQAVAASKDEPKAIETYLAEHPAALRFVTTPKPLPESFATQPFFGVNAFKFTNAKGDVQYGRYRIEPIDGARFLNTDASKAAEKEYLTQELPARLKKGPYAYRISVQLAQSGDEVNDPTVLWPADRRVVELGTLTIDKVSADAQKYEKTMFSPLNLVEGIEPSEDKILLARPTAYAVSFGRRLQP